MDILVTLPKFIEWEEYQKEIATVVDRLMEMRYKVSQLPLRCLIGDRCYLIHKNLIQGWMEVTGFHRGQFQCSATGQSWKGNFITRSGKFHHLQNLIYFPGFQGFRYIPEALSNRLHGAGLK